MINSVLRLLAAENTQQRRNTFIHKCSQTISFGSFCHSHSLGMMKERHPLFSYVIPQDVVDAISLCGFPIILDKFMEENSIEGYETTTKIPPLAWEVPKPQVAGAWGNTLGKRYKGNCPCTLPWADTIDCLWRHAHGLDRPMVSLSTANFTFVFPTFLIIQPWIGILNLLFFQTQKANNNLVSIISNR